MCDSTASYNVEGVGFPIQQPLLSNQIQLEIQAHRQNMSLIGLSIQYSNVIVLLNLKRDIFLMKIFDSFALWPLLRNEDVKSSLYGMMTFVN